MEGRFRQGWQRWPNGRLVKDRFLRQDRPYNVGSRRSNRMELDADGECSTRRPAHQRWLPLVRLGPVSATGPCPDARRVLAEQEVLEPPRRGLLKTGSDVTVGVEGQADGAVPEHLLHDFRVHALSQQQARGGVAEIVNTNLG